MKASYVLRGWYFRPELIFFFFFFSFCVHGNASSRCPPLREAVRHMQKGLPPTTDRHTHTHTLTDHLRAGGTSADLLRNKPRAMIAEIRRRSNCMLLLSRVKYCWQKACVCVFVFVCVRGKRRKRGKTSRKGECFRKPQTMYHLHTAGCMSDTGLLLWGTIALLLNGCCLTGSHIKASDPVPDARQRGRGGGGQKWKKKKKSFKTSLAFWTRWHDVQLRWHRLNDGSTNFFKMKRQKWGLFFLSLSFYPLTSLPPSPRPPPPLAQHLLYKVLLKKCKSGELSPRQVTSSNFPGRSPF